MPDDYSFAREARGGPKITMGKGMTRVEPESENQGAYSDRIKIEPKYGMEKKPIPSDTEIHKQSSNPVVKV